MNWRSEFLKLPEGRGGTYRWRLDDAGRLEAEWGSPKGWRRLAAAARAEVEALLLQRGTLKVAGVALAVEASDG